MAKYTVCEKCQGTKQYMYDDHHIKTCDACCAHSAGWWKMEKNYGDDNGKYACMQGCGTIVEHPPVEQIMTVAQNV